MAQLWVKEIGWHTGPDGAKFVTTYRVDGLPPGHQCVIGYDGTNTWKITWHKDNELLPITDPPYTSAQLALDAISQRLESL
jgi:hypothetical protein